MSSDNNSFDDLVRSKFDGDTEPVESFMWDAIEKQLPAGKTRKRFAYWRLVALLLLISIPASVIYYINNDKASSAEIATTAASQQQQSQTGIYSTPTAGKSQAPNPEVNNSLKSQLSITGPNVAKQQSSENKKPISQKNISPAATNDGNNTIVKNEQQADAAIPQSTSFQSQEPNNNAAQQPSAANTQNTDIQTSQPDSATKQTQPEAIKPDSLAPQKIIPANWFVEIFYSPDYANRTLQQNNDDANYLKLRKNTEQFIYAHSYGIRIGRKINNNIQIKTGMDYTDVQYQLTYGYFPGQVPLPAGLKIDSITGIVIDPLNNGIVTNTDTIVANYELVGQNSVENRYRFYNIPVMIGYTVGKNRMKLEACVGGFINVASAQKGSIISDDRITRINLEEDKVRTPYKSSVGVGLCAEVLMTYSIRKNVKFILGPHSKYYIGKLNKSNAPLNEKLFNAGLLTGFRVEF